MDGCTRSKVTSNIFGIIKSRPSAGSADVPSALVRSTLLSGFTGGADTERGERTFHKKSYFGFFREA